MPPLGQEGEDYFSHWLAHIIMAHYHGTLVPNHPPDGGYKRKMGSQTQTQNPVRGAILKHPPDPCHITLCNARDTGVDLSGNVRCYLAETPRAQHSNKNPECGHASQSCLARKVPPHSRPVVRAYCNIPTLLMRTDARLGPGFAFPGAGGGAGPHIPRRSRARFREEGDTDAGNAEDETGKR